MKAKIPALAALSLAVSAQAFFFDWGLGVAPFSGITIDGTSLNGESEFDRSMPAISSQMHIGGSLTDNLVLALESNVWFHGYECDYYDMSTQSIAIGPALFFYPTPKIALQASVGYSMTLNTFDYGSLFEYYGYEDGTSDIFSGIAFSVGSFYDFMESGPGVSAGLVFTHSSNKLSSGWERSYGLAIAVKFTYKSQPSERYEPRQEFNKTEAYQPLSQTGNAEPISFDGNAANEEPKESQPEAAETTDDGWDSDW